MDTHSRSMKTDDEYESSFIWQKMFSPIILFILQTVLISILYEGENIRLLFFLPHEDYDL